MNTEMHNGFMIVDDVLIKYIGSGGDVVIPNNVTEIMQYAFENCKNITSVIIPDGVVKIHPSTFRYSTNLTSVVIPDSVTHIGEYAFTGCSKLRGVILPKNLTSIGSSAFYRCENLTTVLIPDGVTRIGDYAFYDCSGISTILIHKSVRSIGTNAFNYCSSLKDMYYKGTIEDWCSISFGGRSANPMRFADNSYILTKNYTLLTDLVIPDTVSLIGAYAFNMYGHRSLVIPKSVTCIDTEAFLGYNCSLFIFIFKRDDSHKLKMSFIEGEDISIFYEGSEEEWNEKVEANSCYNNILFNCTKEMFDEYRKI